MNNPPVRRKEKKRQYLKKNGQILGQKKQLTLKQMPQNWVLVLLKVRTLVHILKVQMEREYQLQKCERGESQSQNHNRNHNQNQNIKKTQIQFGQMVKNFPLVLSLVLYLIQEAKRKQLKPGVFLMHNQNLIKKKKKL